MLGENLGACGPGHAYRRREDRQAAEPGRGVHGGLSGLPPETLIEAESLQLPHVCCPHPFLSCAYATPAEAEAVIGPQEP